MNFNSDLQYKALTEVQFTPGPDTKYGTGGTIQAPGGTCYKRTAGGGYDWQIYYPEGDDWAPNAVMDQYLQTDLNAEYLGLDKGKNYDAAGWALARALKLRALQTRSGHDGNVYQAGDWNTVIRDPDEVIFRSNSEAWMQWWMMQNNLISPVSDHWEQCRRPSQAPVPRCPPACWVC